MSKPYVKEVVEAIINGFVIGMLLRSCRAIYDLQNEITYLNARQEKTRVRLEQHITETE